MNESRPTQVFISYAHADSARVADFRRHFGPVERGRNLTAWFDRNLTAGDVWDDEIRRQINASDIFVCLVSAAFLDSPYIRDTELPAIWQAVRGRGALLVPVVLEECFWKEEFGTVQCLPKTKKGDLKPINKWRPKADSYHAAADQAAKAIDAWLKRLPPPPADPGPRVALLVTANGFDLAPDAPAPAERTDPLQAKLLAGLRDRWRELLDDAKRSCLNTHPVLVRDLERYGPLIEKRLADLDVVALTTAGSALGALVAAAAEPAPGTMAEPLEPHIRAGFETVLREHARLVLGFAEAREMIARDGLMNRLVADPPAMRQTLHDVLEPMVEAPGLLTPATRNVIRMIDDALIEAGMVSQDMLATAVRQGGFSIASIARAIGRRIGSPDKAITYATFAAILAGDPNLETYRAAFQFMTNTSAQLLAFAAHQPELRRLIDWTMEQMGRRPSPGAGASVEGRFDEDDAPPPDFDMAEVRAMILRGEAPPKAWVPWINELDLSDNKGLVNLAPLSGLTALQKLDCSQTLVNDLGPLSGVTTLQHLACWETSVSDLGPLSGLTALQSLDCAETSVSDLSPLSGLAALESFACWGTPVSDLGPLSSLSALNSLACGRTLVSDLGPLSKLTALQNLSFAGTSVSDLGPLSNLKALQRLDCPNTSVSVILPLSGLTALQSHDCSGTSVSDLSPLSGLTALQILDCSETGVSDLGPLAHLTELRKLDCSRTAVSDIGPLSGLSALDSFSCRQTGVADLTPLRGLTALRRLNFSETSVSDLSPVSGLIGLKSLFCSRTFVSDLRPISGLKALNYLFCSVTSVSDLGALSGLTAMHSLDCSVTLVSDLSPLSGLTALQRLDCSETSVLDLGPLTGLTALESLYLADLPGPLANVNWIAGRDLHHLVLLGTSIDRPIQRWAKHQIDPNGTVHDEGGTADGWFAFYAERARERSHQGTKPGL